MAVFDALHPVTAIDPRSAIAQRQTANLPFLARLQLGQHVRATVQAALSNGEFRIVLHLEGGQPLGGATLNMKLPAGTQTGDVLNLTFVARLPLPEFALTTHTAPSIESPSLLSVTGRFIDDLLHRPVFPDNSVAFSRNAPLLGKPPDDGLGLSLRLAQAVTHSGLFYESHQAQWAAGARPFLELLMEPQAHLAGPRSLPPSANINDMNASPTVREMADPVADDTVPAPGHIHSHSDSDLAHRYPNHLEPVHRHALALVRQQLEVLETRHVTWQGEAWPGQAITLEIFEEDYRGREERDEMDQDYRIPWKTRLGLDLPNLGRVIANLRLHQQGLEVSLSTTDHGAKAVLQSSAGSLAQGLGGAGIKLLGMGVKTNEEQG